MRLTKSLFTGTPGPGDILPGALAWWGLRAYNANVTGVNAIRLREDSGNTESNFTTVKGGGIDLVGITSFKGSANLFITKIYDQTGNGHTFSQSTAASQPGFTLNGFGSLPIMTFNGSQFMSQDSTIVQTGYSFSFVFKRTNVTTYAWIISDGNSFGIFFDFQVPDHFLFNDGIGTSFFPTTDNVWHSFQTSQNGAGTFAIQDGILVPFPAVTSTPNFSFAEVLGNRNGPGGVQWLEGNLTELGMWAGGLQSSISLALDANQHAYWGF